MESQTTDEQALDVQHQLLDQAKRQTALLQSISSNVTFFVILTWVGIGLTALYFLISLSS